jgi:hypothetical protein
MKKAIISAALLMPLALFYACNDDSDTNPVVATGPYQLTATLSQPTSTSGTPTAGTGTFSGTLDQTSNQFSYSVTFAGISPTAVTMDPVSSSVSTGTGTGTSSFANSILLAGAFPTTSTTPGSGTSTTPGSGTSTTPGSGTTTTPGSGTSTTPGSGTSTTPGSGTSTTPGSGTSTTPGSGTSTTPGSGTSTTPGSGTSTAPGSGTSTGTGVTLTSPLSGTLTVTQSRADSIRNGLYQINIRTAANPNGELRGTVQVR